MDENKSRGQTEKEVMIWKEDDIKVLEQKTKKSIFDKMETEERWNELKEKIKSCIKKRRGREKYKARLGQKFWWDRECSKEKNENKEGL